MRFAMAGVLTAFGIDDGPPVVWFAGGRCAVGGRSRRRCAGGTVAL
jgi:hypothetical protein